MKLGLIGATGWIGQALGLRLISQGLWPATDLILANRSGPGPAYAGLPVTWADPASLCAQADVLILATRPEDFPMPGFAPGRHLILSMMTVWTLAKLRRLAPEARLARAMPNGAAPQGASFTPWTGDLAPADAALVARILSAIGPTDRVAAEADLDYLAALSGSGSAYPALMARALLADALARGLPEPVARRAVESVVVGSAAALKGRIGDLDAILSTYRGYKGVTAAGLDAAELGLTRALQDAMAAAFARARALGQEH